MIIFRYGTNNKAHFIVSFDIEYCVFEPYEGNAESWKNLRSTSMPSWSRWIESGDKSTLYSWIYDKKYVRASFLKQEFFKVEVLHPT